MKADPLVSCAWLAERLDAPDIRIIDATYFLPGAAQNAKALYQERRIPGAIFFDIDEIADTDNPLPHMLPSPEKFAARMRAMGVGDGMRIVIYDSQGLFSAARVWWNFRAMGHEDVAVLDGGLPAWIGAGLKLDDGPPAPRPQRHFTTQFRADLVRDLADMRRIVDGGGARVIDARAQARFRGEVAEPRAGLRSGHMPGARNVPFDTLLNQQGLMRSREELAQIFAAAGVDTGKPASCSCGSGVTAPIIALALARLGRWDAAVYDGSWTEWGARADTPVVTGPA